jgi:hypothetical protein
MTIVGWIIVGVVLLALALYLRLPLWFDIPSDPWSPRLETKGYLYEFYPRWLQVLYEHNLAWRRNTALERWRRKEAAEGQSRYYAPYTDDDRKALEGALGRRLDSDMRRQLSDPNV